MITEDRVQKALTYLAETDSHLAELAVDVERQHYKLKEIKASLFTCSDGNIEQRKAYAETAEPTQDAITNYLDSLQLYKSMENKRKTEELIVRLFQTESANRRQGNI
jgi:hypothetical protein